MVHDYLKMVSRLKTIVKQVADDVIVPPFVSGKFDEQTKRDGSVLTEVDKHVQDKLEAQLRSHWPDIAFLGEEMSVEVQQKLMQSQSVWCLDPIDGTSNFASGIPFFGVSLALIDNQQSVLGLIYDPLRKECFTAVKGKGCWLNGTSLSDNDESAGALKEMIAVVDLKRLLKPPYNKLLTAICENHPYRSQRNFGSCALEWCWLAAGRFQIYIHGGQKLWDYAAGNLILNEAGGNASTIEGEAITPQNLKPQSVVAGCSKSVYQTWYEWVSENK